MIPFRCGILALGLAAATGCGDEGTPKPPAATHGDLAQGVVAEVGTENVAASTVARIATIEGLDRRAALDVAIRDAVFAAAAREDLPEGTVASAERRVLAHAILRELWLESKARPITEEELDEAASVRWTKVDRPMGYRTVHFVVRVGEEPSGDTERRAEALAEALREAVLPVAEQARHEPAPELDGEAMFRRTMKHPDAVVAAWEAAVEKALEDNAPGDLEVLPQPLPPITAEGRPINHDNPMDPSRFDEEYTRRVVELDERGDVTDVFRSSAGYHVAMLLEITPSRQLTRAEKLEELRSEILRVRALRARRSLLEQLREATAVERPSNIDALLSLVHLELDEG